VHGTSPAWLPLPPGDWPRTTRGRPTHAS
jgi:hypothetical protein